MVRRDAESRPRQLHLTAPKAQRAFHASPAQAPVSLCTPHPWGADEDATRCMRGEWSRSLHHARLHGLAQGERVGEGQLLQNALAAADRERTATAITLVRDAHGRLVGQTAKRSIHGPQKRSGTTTTGTGTGTRAGTRGSVGDSARHEIHDRCLPPTCVSLISSTMQGRPRRRGSTFKPSWRILTDARRARR